MKSHPFPYITELQHKTKIETLSDLLFLQDFTYSLIPWKQKPFEDSIMNRFETVYTKCKNKTIGGWCGLNAEFLRVLLVGYGIKCSSHDYGLPNHKFTHIVIKAELDGMIFLLDPYFNRTYTYRNDFIIQYQDLLRLLNEKKLSCITSRFGLSKKPVDTEKEGLKYLHGEDLEKIVMEGFKAMGIDAYMKSLFNSDDPRLLILLKVLAPVKKEDPLVPEILCP